MKKLICAKDVQEIAYKGQTVYHTDSNTIITPAAVDAAKELGVELIADQAPSCCAHVPQGDSSGELDREMIYQVFQAMAAKGMLGELMQTLQPSPYTCEQDPDGLKVVRGKSVKMDVFDTGDPSANAHYQEVIHKEDSSMSSGFLTIDHSSFDWELAYEEIDYVIEGTLQVTYRNKTYTAKQGDILFVPKGSKVTWASPDCAKLFYVTFPANWPDLMPQE